MFGPASAGIVTRRTAAASAPGRSAIERPSRDGRQRRDHRHAPREPGAARAWRHGRRCGRRAPASSGDDGGGAFASDPLELRQEIPRRLNARVRILGQARAHQVIERRRRDGHDLRDRRRLALEDGGEQTRLALAGEDALARDHFEEHRAEREDVRARVRFRAFDLLRRHVLERAEDRALGGERGTLRRRQR